MRPPRRPMLIMLLLFLQRGHPRRCLSGVAAERLGTSGGGEVVTDARRRRSSRSTRSRYPSLDVLAHDCESEPDSNDNQESKNPYISRRRRRLAEEDPAVAPTRPINWLLDSEDEVVVRHSPFAYVVVLLGNNDIGMRTVGQSLLRSDTVADLVALLGPLVSAQTEARIHAQGWVVRRLGIGDRTEEHAREDVVVCSDGSSCVTEVREVWCLHNSSIALIFSTLYRSSNTSQIHHRYQIVLTRRCYNAHALS